MTRPSSLSVHIVLASSGFSLDVTFDVPPGVTVLFGPSGAGKSRTLGCIAGLVRPDGGKITLGHDVWFDHASGAETPIHHRRVAYVFQSLALFPHMTALENVAYGVPKTLDRGKRLDRAVAMLTRMHVPHLTERKPPTFSGGEAQRVALARAFAMDPKVLLLDEPFSALDRRVKNALMTETADWVRRESIPTILVTHDAEEARMLGNRLVHIESGRIVESQSAADRAVPPPPGA